ncbi:MAG: zinc-ribbon domain-containing protein [Acidobacteria bacterium]|nr:zinc-ribbon domain-containing protein [Acidobacteriota bacterium]
MFCSRCGNPITNNENFCPRCGSPAASAGVAYVPASALSMTPVTMKRPGVITLLAVLDLIGGGLYVIGALALALSIGVAEWDVASMVAIGIIGLIGLVLLLAGSGLLLMKEFGRLTQLGLAVLGLIGFPLGTIISVLILYYLTRPGVRILFSERRIEELSSDEVAEVAKVQSSGGAGVAIAIAAGILVVVAIIGILAAIAIPNLLTAMQRSKQKRTVADMRLIATAIESYATDNNTYAPRGWTPPSADAFSVSESDVKLASEARVDMELLARSLTPTYSRILPRVDGWNRPIEVYVGEHGYSYGIRSLGKDGAPEGDVYQSATTTNFDCDIVFAMGAFVAYPEGLSNAPR